MGKNILIIQSDTLVEKPPDLGTSRIKFKIKERLVEDLFVAVDTELSGWASGDASESSDPDGTQTTGVSQGAPSDRESEDEEEEGSLDDSEDG